MKLLYLGNCCAPAIIISFILHINKPMLPFQLMVSSIKNINMIIEDDFKYITDKNFLVNPKREKFDEYINIKNEFAHSLDTKDWVYHLKYTDLLFNHDFFVENNKILNHKFIETQWKEKENNLIEMLKLKEKKLFLHFTQSKIDMNNYQKFLSLLKAKYNADLSQIYILIFTNNNENYCKDNIQIIKLDNDYTFWWQFKDMKEKYVLYKEIYEKFHDYVSKIDPQHGFPAFENTDYSKLK